MEICIRVPIKTYYNKLKCSFSYQFQIELLEKGHIFVIVLASKCEAFLAFVFSKKATKIDEIFAIDLTLLHNVKSMVKISPIFVAFLENLYIMKNDQEAEKILQSDLVIYTNS